MDNRKDTINRDTVNRLFHSISQDQLQLGTYKQRGRVAKIHRNHFFVDGLHENPQQSAQGKTIFELTNWLLDKPRLIGEHKHSFILSALDKNDFSGSDFHPNHRLFVDSFNSPHHWRDGEPRSQAQLVDMLMPSGQWHRHYDMVVLPSDANDLQVELVRHWLELTGGSLLIIESSDNAYSPPIQSLLDDLEPLVFPEAPSANSQNEKQSGMQVTAFEVVAMKEMTTTVYPLQNLAHYASGLPDKSVPTLWVYEGEITSPETGQLHFYIDTLYHPDDLTLEINQLTQSVSGEKEYGEIILKNVQAGKPIPFKISTFTLGQAPEIRLGWGFPDSETIQAIPQDAIHFTPPSEQKTPPSSPTFIQPTKFNPYGSQHTLSVPATSINTLALTEDTLENSFYFSIIINDLDNEVALRLDDIPLPHLNSWEALADEIEHQVNQQLAEYDLPPVAVHYSHSDRQLVFDYPDKVISQFQLKNYQFHSILVAENPNGDANKFVAGALSGYLPLHDDIDYFELIESPIYGDVRFNRKTGWYQYIPDKNQSFQGHDQFDFVAIMKDGLISAPISIQIQADAAPLVSIPGQRTFMMSDPIYRQPLLRHQPVPDDMQVNDIQLAQIHLQNPDAPYFSLTADRWVLLKVDLTSPSAANAPDIVAIIRDPHGNELERVTLSGPQTLPSVLDKVPTTPSIQAADLHHQSYTAPIKGKWVQPHMQIQIMAGTKPITQPYTSMNGIFSPKVTSVTPMTSHIFSTYLYRQRHGIYAYSALSWGLEAAAKLPTHQFTLFAYPTVSLSPSLYPYLVKNDRLHLDKSTLVHPHYDDPNKITESPKSQIRWAYSNSQKAARRTQLYSEFFYSSIERLLTFSGSASNIGIGSDNYGGGIADSSTLWHEVYGHGLDLRHTTHENYPYNSRSHGQSIAFDQHRQQYTTYRKKDPNSEITPEMYPYAATPYTEQYDAFLTHSDYNIQQAQSFLARIDERAVPREYLPVYQLDGLFLPLSDGSLHPYSQLTVISTMGHLIQQDHSDSKFRLKVTYSTPFGTLTETLKVALNDNQLNLNIANKGELVSLEIIQTEDQTETAVYHYKNPESLANRLFIHSDGKTVPKDLQMDNYWRGSKLFWSVSEDNRALCAKWVENGQLYQRYFSLESPLYQHPVDTKATFIPLNHLDLQEYDPLTLSSQIRVLSDVQLLSDVQVNQQINIGDLGSSAQLYWATLCTLDEHGEIQESTPLEAWYISAQDGILTVRGTLDSTPDLNIAGINVYMDSHLQDNVAAESVFIQQNTQGTLAENREFLNYDRPVDFNALFSHMSAMKEEQTSLQNSPIQWAETTSSLPLVA